MLEVIHVFLHALLHHRVGLERLLILRIAALPLLVAEDELLREFQLHLRRRVHLHIIGLEAGGDIRELPAHILEHRLPRLLLVAEQGGGVSRINGSHDHARERGEVDEAAPVTAHRQVHDRLQFLEREFHVQILHVEEEAHVQRRRDVLRVAREIRLPARDALQHLRRGPALDELPDHAPHLRAAAEEFLHHPLQLALPLGGQHMLVDEAEVFAHALRLVRDELKGQRRIARGRLHVAVSLVRPAALHDVLRARSRLVAQAQPAAHHALGIDFHLLPVAEHVEAALDGLLRAARNLRHAHARPKLTTLLLPAKTDEGILPRQILVIVMARVEILVTSGRPHPVRGPDGAFDAGQPIFIHVTLEEMDDLHQPVLRFRRAPVVGVNFVVAVEAVAVAADDRIRPRTLLPGGLDGFTAPLRIPALGLPGEHRLLREKLAHDMPRAALQVRHLRGMKVIHARLARDDARLVLGQIRRGQFAPPRLAQITHAFPRQLRAQFVAREEAIPIRLAPTGEELRGQVAREQLQNLHTRRFPRRVEDEHPEHGDVLQFLAHVRRHFLLRHLHQRLHGLLRAGRNFLQGEHFAAQGHARFPAHLKHGRAVGETELRQVFHLVTERVTHPVAIMVQHDFRVALLREVLGLGGARLELRTLEGGAADIG